MFVIEKADRAKSKVCVALAGDSGSERNKRIPLSAST